MKKGILIFAIALLLFPALLSAQLKRQDTPISIREELIKPANNFGLSILDPSKIKMSHSFSMSYFSIGGKGVAQNIYLNTLQYQIAQPLMLTVQWGIRQTPYNSLAKDSPLFNSGFFLSGAELRYKPTENLEMNFQISTQPNYYSPYYYNRFGRSMFFPDLGESEKK